MYSKGRDITWPTKVHIVKAMVSPVVMNRCESWTIKKAEHQTIDAFKLWCWKRLLRVPWTARRSKQSIQRKSALNIHWKDGCWSWSFNTLAIWCEEPTLWCWERLKAKGEGVGAEDEMVRQHHWLNGHEFVPSQGVKDNGLACCSPGARRVVYDLVTEEQQSQLHSSWL